MKKKFKVTVIEEVMTEYIVVGCKEEEDALFVADFLKAKNQHREVISRSAEEIS